jgi:hypothetical protein
VDAIQAPDQHERLGHRRVEVELFTRHVDTARRPHTLHVTALKTARGFEIHTALKVFDDLAPGVRDLSPVAMLERFASIFGLPTCVGNRVERLFRACTLARNPAHGRALYRLPRCDWNAITVLFLETTETDLHVTLAWSLNLTAYRAHLMRAI